MTNEVRQWIIDLDFVNWKRKTIVDWLISEKGFRLQEAKEAVEEVLK